jgi:PAS domain S-box-containing protein
MPLSVAWVARQTLMIDLTGNEIPLVGIVWLDVVGSLFILLISLRTMQLTDLERLEARSEEDRFRALTEASFEGIAILRSAKIYDLNPTFSRMFGYQPEELRGVEFQELLAPESRRRWANRPSLTGQASEALEQRAMTRGGRRFDVEVRTHQVLYQEVLSEVVVLRDVTDRKEYERELFKTQAEAIRAMHAKSSFLAQMSHEIRTPLHGVIGITEILKETPLSEDQKGLVATLEDSGRALLQIVDDVLDFSRMESNQVSIEMREFLLASLLQGVLGQMTALASAKGIGLDSEVSDSLSGANLSLRGDEHRIRQVLLNLISNAIKFTEAGKITIRVSEATNDGVRFEVVDSGMGIEESMLEQIFQPFVQADSSISRRFGGSGLGLTISKNLVELMGGTMGVVSQLGVGSTFWFQLHLPRGIRSTAITQDFTRSITRDLQKVLSVWVVEDHPTNQMIVVRMLESAGLLARVFQSGKELIERMVNDSEFRGALPHVILMDVQMPDMDGYVTTQRIREFGEKWQSVPILAMTAHALEGDREKCLQAGMDDYLSKPLQKEELIQRVRHWAEMGRVT